MLGVVASLRFSRGPELLCWRSRQVWQVGEFVKKVSLGDGAAGAACYGSRFLRGRTGRRNWIRSQAVLRNLILHMLDAPGRMGQFVCRERSR